MNRLLSTAVGRHRAQPRRAPRPGFTLLELLIAVSIMLILLAITASAIKVTSDADRVRGAARQIQSYLEGARSRAVAARAPRGVRFLLDPTDPRTVTSMVYIAPTDPWTEGTIWLERPDLDHDGIPAYNDSNDPMHPNNALGQSLPIIQNENEVYVLRGFDYSSPAVLSAFGFTNTNRPKDTNWLELYRRGLLRDGELITLQPGNRKYAIDTRLLAQADPSDGDPPVRLLLQSAYFLQAERSINAVNTPPPTAVQAFDKPYREGYSLQLAPAPLANQEPVQLPKGVVIHLDRCSSNPDGFDPSTTPPTWSPQARGNKLPSTWKRKRNPTPSQTWQPDFEYTPYCDILFSPRGMVVGPEASQGIIHLYVCEQKDADRDRLDWAVDPATISSPVRWSAPEYGASQTASDPNGPLYERGDKLVVSIFTRTGAITVNPVHPQADSQPSERFRYSETGEVAGK